jgi:hypothetical protein
MQKWLWRYAATVVIVGGITVVQNVWNLSKSDWASWAQAIGGVSAVAAAIWLASREDRRRAREALAAARLTAAALTFRLGHAQTEVFAVWELFRSMSLHDEPYTRFNDAAQRFVGTGYRIRSESSGFDSAA